MGFRWKLTLALIALFVIGGLCGSALTLVANGTKKGGAGRMNNWEERAFNNLRADLDLNRDQQTKVRPLVVDAIRQMRSQTFRSNDTIFGSLLDRISEDLTADQRDRLQKLREKRRKRLERILQRFEH